jgi:hypothetical protein
MRESEGGMEEGKGGLVAILINFFILLLVNMVVSKNNAFSPLGWLRWL